MLRKGNILLSGVVNLLALRCTGIHDICFIIYSMKGLQYIHENSPFDTDLNDRVFIPQSQIL